VSYHLGTQAHSAPQGYTSEVVACYLHSEVEEPLPVTLEDVKAWPQYRAAEAGREKQEGAATMKTVSLLENLLH